MKAANKIKSLILILGALVFTFGNPAVEAVQSSYEPIHVSENDQLKNLKKRNINKPAIIMGGLGLTVLAVGVSALIVRSVRKSGESSHKSGESDSSWPKVAGLYKKASESEKSGSPESVEHLADYYRCLMYEDLAVCKSDPKKFSSTNATEAEKYYKQAADLYDERAKQFSGKNSYDFQINSVKAAELRAKAAECCFEADTVSFQNPDYDEGLWVQDAVSWAVNFSLVDSQWQKVKGIKKSYDAYAEAKYCEYIAESSGYECKWDSAAQAWEKVKSDEDLKQSFGGETKYWFAYRAFAEANRQECLLHCTNKTTKEKVRKSWLEASRLDLKASNSPIYLAFAAEAEQRAKCLEN